MTKTNKKIMQDLTAHFLESDPKEIARAFANLILDVHRLKTYDFLPIAEQISLIERLDKNDAEFVRFVNEGPKKGEKFKIVNMSHDQT